MRGLLIALAFGLAAVAAVLFALRGGGEPPTPTPPTSLVSAPASAAAAPASPPPEALVPAAEPPAVAPPAASTVVAAVTLPEPSQAPPAVRSAFALSSDHRTLIQGTPLADRDLDRLENELRDDAWATEAERLIRQELARHGSAADFDIIAVDCRQTLCAIQAFSSGESGHRLWVAAIDEIYTEALSAVFDSVNTAFPGQGSGRAPVLTFLHRKPMVPKR